ncbi:uncharacterized protein LOC132852462 [Tachysurus vachellii]|uniref:uncharacterized protein LOC132852462 n=1 Tax=Tachysurus vachellii TaxID=175792 RepID=UPI00296B084C|nr:uncharacterized protein LOC132852462 [Tachysurus vachellii]
MDNKYTPISRRTISEKQIPVLVKTVKETVLKKLESSVSLTTDLWSDRRLRSFGVTAHVCNKLKDSDSYALESYLLDCRHFTGRHSEERIASAFEEITEEYGIRQKISYIITDNAANMKCTFKVHMPQQQSDDSESEEENLDDEHLWEDMNLVEDTELPWSSDTLISEVEKISSEGEATHSEAMNVDPPSDSPPVKFPRLLSLYKAHKKRSSTSQDSSIETQISKYFDAIHDTDTDTDNALSFWAKNHDRYPQLHNVAMKVLSVPASSAPVERVFSRGGIIMRPHHARLGHKMLQSLIFLKCTQMLL